MFDLKSIIEYGYKKRKLLLSSDKFFNQIVKAIDDVVFGLNNGKYRVAEKKFGKWIVNSWVKKAIFLYFKLNKNSIIDCKYCKYYDKFSFRFLKFSEKEFSERNIRVVPHAVIRNGVFIGNNSVLMPCFINIGAYIGKGTMIDTWATIGSCAQIGDNVHISGGAGIGGVLEPIQDSPTIIEDNCFIGARSEIVEGVIVESYSVISMGVFIGKSTKIYNRLTGSISYGRIPCGSVVVPGSIPSRDGNYSLSCAVIVKKVDKKTFCKVKINDILRNGI
ncbi:2,3,4,5-tetrahydropyridine-2,6-dicarboxylate N-succinyltransferase [Candidatus Legionella polyplacis]|uniref:2,3,4,5-tetrahydropyridine-2,6-dicarboxylate N-succinyltransferase n=1 Tax=Candidatus Legionella polyplacis TaxID=2005262 RepID=A0ABZ2H1W2_9GAMM